MSGRFFICMKLILIYGAPAAGKYTVGTELARLTGYKLFHNHLSIDCVKPVIDFGTPAFWRVIKVIRNETIAEAAREGISVIHTFCYEFGADDKQLAELIAAAEDNGGEIHLVLLLASKEVRRQRMANDSRVQLQKLTDPKAVDRSTCVLDRPFPGRETLEIETTALSPEAAANQIIEHYKLELIGES
jgi:hypothetical protein